jgi:hypothetical protein
MNTVARRRAGSCLLGLVALLAAGCGASTSSGGPTSPALASGVPASAGGTSAGSGGSSSGGSGSGSGGGVALSDPCSLLTQAEVSSALGKTVGPGVAESATSCAWAHTASSGAIDAQASIDIEGVSFDKLCGVPSNAALGITMTQLTGVGDAACIAEMTGVLPVLTFEKDGHVLSTSVGLGNVPPATSEAAEKALAIAAATRI